MSWTTHPTEPAASDALRDRDTIDDELRMLAAVRWSIREHGGEPSSRGRRTARRERFSARCPIEAAAEVGVVSDRGRVPRNPARPAPAWKQPAATADDPISQLMEYLRAQPQLIVCGHLGLQPLTEAQRHDLLSGGNLFDALETVARLQSQWDIAYTTTRRQDLVEVDFLF